MKEIISFEGGHARCDVSAKKVRELIKRGLRSEMIRVEYVAGSSDIVFFVDGETIVADRFDDGAALRLFEQEFPVLRGKLV